MIGRHSLHGGAGRRTIRLAAALAAAPALWLSLGLGHPVAAQPILLTAGEHASFTRIVLQSRGAFVPEVTEDGATLRIAVPGRPIRLDPERLFARIPRSRLAEARLDGDRLLLIRPCDCPFETIAVRPGVVAIDLRDGPPAQAGPRPEAPGRPRVDPATGAGLALARRLAREEQAPDPDPSVVQPEALLRGLAARLAEAMTSGLADPGAPSPAPRAPRTRDALAGPPDLGPHLRLRNPETAATEGATEGMTRPCPDPEVFAFLTATEPPPFGQQLGSLRATLYGEFDQPASDSALALVQHYLAWGLGPEARQLLDGASYAVPGSDLLGGLADLLDGLGSNRRARLAGHLDCPGPAGLFAALAGPEIAPDRAPSLAATFVQLPAALRAELAPDLVARLLAVGAQDAARMIHDSVARTEGAAPEVLALMASALARARGHPVEARAQAEAVDPASVRGQGLRLDLDFGQGMAAPATGLADAMALAEAERSTAAGRDLAELAIRHHILAGRAAEGLGLLDQFATWLDASPGSDARIRTLRAELWSAALSQDDSDFLNLALTRADWRVVQDPTLLARIDARLRDLGLAALADTVSRSPDPGVPPGSPLQPGLDGAQIAPAAGSTEPADSVSDPPSRPRAASGTGSDRAEVPELAVLDAAVEGALTPMGAAPPPQSSRSATEGAEQGGTVPMPAPIAAIRPDASAGAGQAGSPMAVAATTLTESGRLRAELLSLCCGGSPRREGAAP